MPLAKHGDDKYFTKSGTAKYELQYNIFRFQKKIIYPQKVENAAKGRPYSHNYFYTINYAQPLIFIIQKIAVQNLLSKSTVSETIIPYLQKILIDYAYQKASNP